ncbi:hypothetical protein ACWT_2922 [Actinoplanes sp. SE50]|uniref:hypothetical protein n=1 Tax=unclassified Actinoplanes TaxID=2626549 RepID=UPI00023EC09B|nr:MULTISPECIES: hypothetical protein [unclassified Actinoplanes]AEV83519.1 hypothetical protein ACPL_2624 [Actinoplanes sp. SE50/110]ATO82337.1 hypothetical protein ACWT_2922 [Actinoplanes sp. SE50]SLL99744.1 hypothetical protein ACSP50_2975 [Actinoplanes sp. SE50/110]
MIIVVMLWLAALATGVWAVWPAKEKKVAAVAPPRPEPGSLEGVLVAQLVRAEISAAQYRRAVEGIAARDEQRHPMSVPGEEA